MLCLLRVLSVLATQFFRYRRDLLLENLALRQQLAVWKRRRPQPRLSVSDKLFWVTLRRVAKAHYSLYAGKPILS
jgi:putative transposase